MRRRGACAALIALALVLGAETWLLQAEGTASPRRSLAATADAAHPECPRAALYIITALPNVKDAATFQLVRSTYIATVKSLAPAGAISDVLPWSTEPNRIKGGIAAHTIVLFSGSCEAGKAAARALHVKLLGDVRTLFYVPAPRAKSLFGDVYMITVGFPYLADGYGKELSSPAAPAGTNLAAQFSITWEDVPPSKIGERQAAAFKAAILKQLPAGAGVYFTTMITQGVSYRYGNHWRACAAPVSPTVAKSAGKTSQGGSVWPPGQPADVKSGRLVFNTNIHGTVFNTAAGKATLAQFLDRLRINAAAVFPPATFGRMLLSGGSGLRLVNDPAYPCACETAPPPTLTSAQAFGPNSATATATGASNVTWARWRFTATPTSGPALVQQGDSPLVWWYNLAANTRYTIRAVGITRTGEEVPSGNSITITTPQSGAPTLASADPNSPNTAVVRIAPPSNTQANAVYTVIICLKSNPTNCIRKSSQYIQITVPGLTPGAAYVVSASAKVSNKPVPSSNSLPLVMPARGAPVLLTAAASSARTGAATAAPPNGVTFSQYIFTAKPLGGGASLTSKVSNPRNGQFSGLLPSTQYDVTVVGVRNGVASPASNKLSFVTPAANAPLNTGVAKNPSTVIVKLFAPTLPPLNGGAWVKFDVTLCPIAGPQSACVTQQTGATRGRRLLEEPAGIAQFEGRDPFSTYNFVSNAISNTDERSKQAMTGQVTTPGAVPWSLEPLGASATQTTVTVKINPPAEGGPYDSFLLSVCLKPASGQPNWDACPTTTCLPSQVSGCLVSGLAANRNYTVSAIAISGETSSVRSNAADFTTLPWPAPEVTVVLVPTAATVSVVAPSAAPPNGWQKYVLRVCPISPAGACFERDCTPVKTPPAATTCQLTGLDESTKYSLRVTAVQGIYAAPSALKTFTVPAQDGPAILSVKATSSVSGVACLEPPTQGGPWAKYSCAACFAGSCVTAPTCNIYPTRSRGLLAQACTSGQACNLPNLEASTPYTVSCKALTATNAPSPVTNSTDTLDTWQAGPPTVQMSTTNPVIAACTAPGGGPWATCALTLCPAYNKRRSLLDGGCVTTSCPFSGSAAACNLAGLVEQGLGHSVNATAVKADGVRKSQSTGAPLPIISVPLFPKPTVFAKSTGGKSWNVSVIPNTTTPLFSYPEGGWVWYSILVQQGANSKTVKCSAVVINGVPRGTVCPVTLTSSALPTFTVTAVKGSSSNPVFTDLRSAPSDSYTPQDGPTILSASSNSPNSATICLEPPTQGGPWVKYACKACYGASCVTAPTCNIVPGRRRLLGGGCATGTTCNIPNLEASTPYTISCKAQTATNTGSPTTNSTTPLMTKTAPPPALQMDPANPVVLQCIAPSGGPWSVCNVQFCASDNRRRSLRAVQCDSMSCPFSGNVANCNLTHFLPQELVFTANGTAVKADGTRKSQSTPAPLPSFIIPLFPKPIFSVVIIGENTYNVTMTPNVTTPLISYPAGGWGVWAISATNGTVQNGTYCVAQQQNGVPKVTSCVVTLPFTGAVPTFYVAAYQGTLGSNLNLELHTAVSDPYIPQDGPTIVYATKLGYSLGAACVSKPTVGGPWSGVNCTACAGANCVQTQCAPGGGGRRRLQSFDCGSSLLQCEWDHLYFDTSYGVQCVAFNTSGATSPKSVTNSTFTTERPPPPVVELNGKDAISVKCIAPVEGGGDPASFPTWKTCNLTLCLNTNRRRELLGTGCPSGAITTSCPFDSSTPAVAICVLGGLVQQNKQYSVKSVAVTSNGYTSEEGEWAPFEIFTFPKPTLSILKTSNTSFNVTVIPDVVTPGMSFPTGGWNFYRINVTVGGVSTIVNCTAVVDGSGTPQPTDCPITVAAGALPTFVATCFTGNPSSPQPTDLYSYPSDDTPAPGAPTIVKAGSTTANAGTACITAPTAGASPVGYNCTVCRLGTCSQAPTCPNSRRRRSLLGGVCTSGLACQLPDLESSTEYNVSCIAINSIGVASAVSNTEPFTVIQANAPAVAADPTNPLVAQCTAPIGGPWDRCDLSICPPAGRRRHLLESGCFNATCPFNATTGIAECDLIDQVAQLASYSINSTAVKADCVRSSKTQAQPAFLVPLYPKPTVTNALAINQTYFTMTITADTASPFTSYPPGGWTHFYLNSSYNGASALDWCTANVSNGVPQPTDCQFSISIGGGGQTIFQVWGFRGSNPASPVPTDLLTDKNKAFSPQDGPNITSITATGYNSSQACMSPPIRGTFSAYNCTACTGGTCLAPTFCGASQGSCAAGKIQCVLDGLEADTEYSVSCVAWTVSSVSPASNTVTVTTNKAPAPPVTADPTNPLVAQCTAPPAGPWANCTLNICPPARRRHLLDGGCFTTTCPFNSTTGIADCNLIDLVEQTKNYTINSTAIKADGIKTSLTEAQPLFLVPYYPMPSVTNAEMLGLFNFRMTITPNLTSPYTAYPPGGWTHYIVKCDFNVAISYGWCTANTTNGVPQVTDCSITCSSGSEAYTMLTVKGYRGDPSSALPTDLSTFETDPFLAQDPPSIISASGTTNTTGRACVAQPINYGPFSSFNCTACIGSSCEAPVSCASARRRSLLSGCPIGETACTLSNLAPSTQYNVTCVAIKTGVVTPTSAPGTFTTLANGGR